MRWACILLPQLALDHALRQRDDPQAPLALLDQACADGAATVDDIVRGGVEAFAFARQILTPQPEEAAA